VEIGVGEEEPEQASGTLFMKCVHYFGHSLRLKASATSAVAQRTDG
jgi:hypothetical protein